MTELLPLLSVDMDGVFVRPFFNWNIGIHRDFLDPAAEPQPARVYPHWLNAPLDHVRFDLRKPLPSARHGLARLSRIRRLVVVTGRRTSPHHWLHRHGVADLFDEVYINDGPLRSPHYKLEVLRDIGAQEHVDDDARTAQLLAQSGFGPVYLRDWPRNRDLPLAPNIIRVRDLNDLADRLGAPEVHHSRHHHR